jgi:hypothetical protein
MRKLLPSLVLGFLIIEFGCSTGLKPGPSQRPPRTIDWQDPVSVVRGFLSAKRRADWKTAYRCCDYDQTLPKEEQARIKKKWKAECEKWPADYADTFWAITSRQQEGDVAFVRILYSRRDPITGKLDPAVTYEEKLKKYGDEWKITNLLAEESSR